MRVPVRIPVGGRQIRIVYKDEVKDYDGSPLYGAADRVRGIIEISKAHDNARMLWSTLYHELQHMAFGMTGQSKTMTDDEEESRVLALEFMLAPLFVISPEAGVRFRDIKMPFEEGSDG